MTDLLRRACSCAQADEHWCVLCPEAQFVWLFRDQELSKAQGLVGALDRRAS